jgi:hypothetical protein
MSWDFLSSRTKRKIVTSHTIDRVMRDWKGEYTLVIDGVKWTFFSFPFPITFPVAFEKIIQLPDLLTLAAMKAYALARRSMWNGLRGSLLHHARPSSYCHHQNRTHRVELG